MERWGVDIDREAVERMLGLDVPVPRAVWTLDGSVCRPLTGLPVSPHFKGLLQGTLGESLRRTHLTVEEEILGRFPVTIELGVIAIVIGLVIALPVGIYSAIRQDNGWRDYVGRTAGRHRHGKRPTSGWRSWS